MGSLKQWFGLYQFPTGRRLFAMRQVAELASTHGLHDIQALAEQAAAQAERAADEELAWRRSRSTKQGRRERAGEIDQALDRMLNAIDKQLANTVHAFPTQPPGEQARKLADHLFPDGVGVITSMTYEDELAAAEVVLKDLQGPNTEAAAAMNLGMFVEGLATLVDEFRDELTNVSSRGRSPTTKSVHRSAKARS